MDKAIIDEFLHSFDESRYPLDFLQLYELIECLAHNQMGETLLIKERQTGIYFVAKCYTDPSLLSNTTENTLLKGLHHPCLPSFINEYQNNKMLCVVREYAQGVPLDKLVRDKPLTNQQIKNIAVQLCDILIYLHEQTPPIIHRDIKPQNIIVNGNGEIKLIDFGISRIYDENAKTDTVFFGTQDFAPPEQYGFSQTDCRSDIFSFGVLLCWLLTGETMIKQAITKIRNKWFVKIIRKCTAFSPKDRYLNVKRVKDALTGRIFRRHVLAILSSIIVISLAVYIVFIYNGNPVKVNRPGASQTKWNLSEEQKNNVTFDEPLIEQAIRLRLSKNAKEKISHEELMSIDELYVFGDKPAANEEMYNTYSNRFVANDGTILRGSISSLNDIKKLKNIRKLCLAYQNISDLEPLSQLKFLEDVELKHNPIQDVSQLSQLASLNSLLLFDTSVSDFTSLSTCPRLNIIDAGYTNITSMVAFKGLDSLKLIALNKAPLKTLEKIESLKMLEKVYLSETQLLDLAPLLDLPRLQLVEVSESMHEPAEAISEKAKFEIIYR